MLAFTFLLPYLAIFFEDHLFFKSDARAPMHEHRIELKDDFTIRSNQSGGFTDYYHSFVLEISARDKKLIVNRIKSASNYRDGRHYVHEFYQPNSRGTAPTYDRVLIDVNENKLTFERIID